MKISLEHIQQNLFLDIIGETVNSSTQISEVDSLEYGEAIYQIKEGCSYEYKLNNTDFKLSDKNPIITISKFEMCRGRICPNIYVGTLNLQVLDKNDNIKGYVDIEVQSVKVSYRQDYRFMLESITDKCTDLIMQIDSPIRQNFEPNFDLDDQSLYQRFCFVKSVIESIEFEEAIQKIISSPTSKWVIKNASKDVRHLKKSNARILKQLISNNKRVSTPPTHSLFNKFHSIPVRIDTEEKCESIDNTENRFVKYTLEIFLLFCQTCEDKFEKHSRAKLEAKVLQNRLENYLNQNFFKNIARANYLKLNSTVLQRKSGYREILRSWLKFDLAAKLIWQGGDNVYSAGKKDIATLYEYWIFFTLLDLFKEIFRIEPKDIVQLLHFDKNKISLTLKQGKTIALKGLFSSESRNFNVQFSYNRSFSGGKVYPDSGSWTTTLRPDYTLSIWPITYGFEDAEKNELITHIHFDAKYKVNNFYEIVSTLSDEVVLNKDKEEEKKGNFKNIDLLKMHSYKDAIRRTGGAYILYPGEGKNNPFRGFHELIPGLGAFVLKPNKDKSGVEELKHFILQIVQHFSDRASQRERHAIKVYEIYKNKNINKALNEIIPENSNGLRIIPDETFVIVGYYKNEQHLDWILRNNLYNLRTGTGFGSFELNSRNVNAKYLLLHTEKELITNRIYGLNEDGVKLFSKADLIRKGYVNPSGESYFVYKINKDVTDEFNNVQWDLRNLSKFVSDRKSAQPITITLTDLMTAVKR